MVAAMFMALSPRVGTAAPADVAGDRVFGQDGSFTTNADNNGGVSADSLSTPKGAAVDGAGRLYVADYGNNRVLEYDNPRASRTANRVFGQGGNFTTNAATPGVATEDSLNRPAGVALDSAGRLYIADANNNRVLEYDSPLTSQTANRVFGQGGNFTTTGAGPTSASSLNMPFDVAVDGSGRLYVAEYGGNRAVEYDSPLTSQTANRVFGQAGNFTTITANNGGISATSLYAPSGLEVDAGGRLYIADTWNNRALEYDNPLTSQTANRVFGQGGSYSTNTSNNGGISANSLAFPYGVAIDGSGRLYIADGNNRVLEYDAPLTGLQTADRVFGQGGSFSSNTPNNGGVSASSLWNPIGVTTDSAGSLVVGDYFNNRVLEHDFPAATVWTVVNNGDAGSCVAHACDFRGALTSAAPGDVINFNIPGAGVHTITPASPLPTITKPLMIDGATQPGFAGAPLIELNGISAGGPASGLVFGTGSSGSSVRGLIINRFSGNGIQVSSNAVVIAGNYIGTNAAGTAAAANKYDVWIELGATNTTVGGTTFADRNVISGATYDGVVVDASAGSGTQIIGNYIGTNAAGSGAIANGTFGVAMSGAGTVGGTAPGAGNVISGNNYGIGVNGASPVTIQGNYIGTAASGLVALPNGASGISLGTGGHTIGGSTAGARNIISGNTNSGILATLSDANTINGNFIGVDKAGNAMGNGVHGIDLQASQWNTIGGIAAGEGNIIAQNGGAGIRVDGTGGLANGNHLRGNNVYGNAGGGIVLVAGGNGGVNAPVITSAGPPLTGTSACGSCEIDIFSDAGTQGQQYEGSTTSVGNSWSFSGRISGPNITATATTAGGGTSPFSAPLAVSLLREGGTPGVAGFSGDGGVATSAQLNGPHGLFLTSGNVLYFADTGNNRIRSIAPNTPLGVINTVAGDGAGCTEPCGATSAQLASPTDVYVDNASGDFFIADTNNCRVRKVVGLTITTVAGTGTCGFNGDGGQATSAQLNHPHGVALDGSGNILIADSDNHRIRKVTVSSGVITTVAGTGNAGFFGEGGPATSAWLNGPDDVYATASGFVIADTLNHRVRRVSGGVISTIGGTGVAGYNGDNKPSVLAQLNGPEALSVEVNGDVFVADTQNNRIRIISAPTGAIATVIGTGATGTSPDAVNPLLATLNQPAGIADETLAVSDTANHTVRTIAANGDPTVQEAPPASRPSTFCREGLPSPVGALADWGVIAMAVGMIAGRKRLRMFIRLCVEWSRGRVPLARLLGWGRVPPLRHAELGRSMRSR